MNKLTAAVKDLKISQQELADRLGVSQQAVSTWLRQGFVPVGRVVEFETQFGIPRNLLIKPSLRGLVGDSEGGL